MIDLIENLIDWLWEITKIQALVVAVSLLVAVLFGPNAPFFGGVLDNL